MNVKQKLLTAAVAVMAFSFSTQPAKATPPTSASGTIGVSCTTVASVLLEFVSDGSGITLSGSGTSAATVAFGTAQAYGGSVPTGVTKTVNGTSDWSLATPIDVVVQVANQTSSNYTLTAELESSDTTNTWSFGGASSLSQGTPSTVTSTGSYGSTPFTLTLDIPFSEAAGSISNTLNITASAN